jgi:three-Cys-motif partner protein
VPTKYNWSDPKQPPLLHSHSLAKHEIIAAYLKRYVEIATSGFRRKKLRLTIIDGFCGGGIYHHEETKKPYPGSPLIFLKTIRKIEIAAKKKHRDFCIDVACYFIDRDANALESLKVQLKKQKHGKLIGDRIFLLKGNFSELYPALSQIISSRGGRVLFLLDQYGYKDAPIQVIKQILQCFPASEILLTFAVDAMLNYMSSGKQFRSYTRKLEPRGRLLSDSDIKEAKRLKKLGTRRKPSDWRIVVSRKLLKRIVDLCGDPHCAPYFIVSSKSHRAYWLLHLSGSMKSSNEMLKLHRAHHNTFKTWDDDKILGFDPRYKIGSKTSKGATEATNKRRFQNS